MKKIVLLSGFIFLVFITKLYSQDVTAESIIPSNTSSSLDHFNFKTGGLNYGGVTLTKTPGTIFGNENSLSLFTSDNRDLTFYSGTGNIILFPNAEDSNQALAGTGHVGIGTLNPTAGLTVNKNRMLLGGSTFKGGFENETVLEIQSTTASYLSMEGAGNSKLFISAKEAHGGSSIHYSGQPFSIGSWDGSPITAFYASLEGNVGIGTKNPGSPLELNYSVGGVPSTSTGLTIRNNAGGNLGQAEVKLIPAVSANDWSLSANDEKSLFRIYSSNVARLVIDGQTGNMGIGTNSPNEKLEVNGNIRTKEIHLEASPWPDYVFESGYELKSLEEVSAFIEKNGHLPNVPSASEVAENGIAVGDMNARVVEKIEELTLYIIQLQNQIDELNEKVDND